jgi:hypothetical protein
MENILNYKSIAKAKYLEGVSLWDNKDLVVIVDHRIGAISVVPRETLGEVVNPDFFKALIPIEDGFWLVLASQEEIQITPIVCGKDECQKLPN